MDFSDSHEEAVFRVKVKDWIAENVSVFASVDFSTLPEKDEVALSRQWIASKAKAGYAAMRLQKAYGGMSATAMQSVIYAQEESKYATPTNYFDITLGMVVPTLLTFASEEQKATLIPRVLAGENIWCQLFSEPSAGSDLAALRTRAVKDGDDWLISGQKVWTTRGHLADYGILLTRSNPELPKHKGLTFFFVDMTSPGIEVRPIKQIDGGAEFNEVYFTDVRIPDAQRLGEVGSGWQVAMTTLLFERQAAGEQSLGLIDFDDMWETFGELQIDGSVALSNPVVQAKLADWYLIKEGLRYFGYRQLTAIAAGITPGPEMSIGKYLEARGAQVAACFATDAMGLYGAIVDPALALGKGRHQSAVLQSPGIRIAGGTDEILLNTIAERVLGMPSEYRTDKTTPFRDL
jgi:alkylation response protein AidB-like acyl-CoA dehydrogenase